MHESDSNSDDKNQDGLDDSVFSQQEKDDKAQECNQDLCNKLKLSVIKKIQGHLLQMHKNKTRQDDVTTTPQVAFKKPRGPSERK